MTSQFTVINNPHIDVTRHPVTAPRPVETDAVPLLTGRQFHMCGEDTFTAVPHVSADTGGVFLVGKYAKSRLGKLRPAYPTVPFIAEPTAVTHYWATEEDPFSLDGAGDSLFPPTLDWSLSLQRMDGSALAMTPTGQIKSGDFKTLKAALFAANGIDRTDTIFTLPLEAGWLSNPDYVKLVIQVINRSRHPVALTFTHKTNPLESVKRLRAYRRIFAETTGQVIAYRTDLAGFDARAHGAIASAIGGYPSLRRLNPVGSRGSAIDPEDMAPHMLVGDMLRFVRTKTMRRLWFAAAIPFDCFCEVCDGQPIDRLFGTRADRALGHAHNVVEIRRLHDSAAGLSQAELAATWSNQVAGAVDTYPQLESLIGRPVVLPEDIKFWGEVVR